MCSSDLLAIPPEFMADQAVLKEQKRMRVRGPVETRRVDAGVSKVTTKTDWLKRLVETGGPGEARSKAYLSVRQRREAFRTNVDLPGDCRGKKERLRCEQKKK